MNKLFFRHIFALVLTLWIGDTLAQSGKIYYVNSANTTGDGNTWNTAFPNLQQALTAASNGAQIWVAKGTYKPSVRVDGTTSSTGNGPRDIIFNIPLGVSLYGHFAGHETSVDERNLENADNTTILSGDVGAEGDRSDNAFHVVGVGWTADPNITCDLDGFTIQDANSNATASVSLGGRLLFRHTGAGLAIAGAFSHRMHYKNLIIKDNYASTNGGGAVLYGANGTYNFHKVRFLNNEAGASAALYVERHSAALNNTQVKITESHFEGNRATATGGIGGAIHFNIDNAAAQLEIENNSFKDNTAGTQGGAIYMTFGNLSVKDSHFENNEVIDDGSTNNGGAIATASHAAFTVTSTNNIFENNAATGSGGAISSQYQSLTIRRGLFSNNTSRTEDASRGGGAIYINNCLLDIDEGTIIRDNTSNWGGGAIYLTGSSRANIRNAFFHGNSTTNQGGAIFMTGTGSMIHEITNTVFYNNTAGTGGGTLLVGSSTATVANSTFYGNTAAATGGALRTSVSGSNLTINNSIILGNSAGTSGPDIARGNGDITVNRSITQGASGTGITNNDLVATNPDPTTVFLNTTDSEHADFLRLRAGSPAINSGTLSLYIGDAGTALDLAGTDRLKGGTIDLGAYESPYEDIVSVGSVPSFSVAAGTSLGDIVLPTGSSTVQATLTNNNTPTLNLLGTDPENNWELIDDPSGVSYDPNAEGAIYKFWVPLHFGEGDDWYSNSQALRAEVQIMILKTPTLTATWNDGSGPVAIGNDGVASTYGEQAVLVITHDNTDGPAWNSITHTLTPAGGTDLVSWASAGAGAYNVTALRANITSEEGTLKISLPATANFAAAELEFKVKINPRPITVSATSGQTKVYGEPDPVLYTYQVTSGNLVGTDAFTGALNRAEGQNTGNYAIQQGTLSLTDNYAITYNSANFEITAKPLTNVTANDVSKAYGEADPALTFTATGLAYNDQASDALTGTLERTSGDDVGSYNITRGNLAAISGGNYTWDTNNFTAGTFTITKASQQITLTAPDEVQLNAGTLPLIISSSSSLPVMLSLDNTSIATLSGTTLNLLEAGTIVVTATQEGNNNYEAAAPVSVTIRIIQSSTDQPVKVHPALSPNGDGINDHLTIEGIESYPDNRITIFDRAGNIIKEINRYDNNQNVFTGESFRDGTYFYRLGVMINGERKYYQGYIVLKR